MKKQNSIESRLAFEMLGESRLASHQRRYEVVQRFLKVYKILPTLEQIVRDLPKTQKIIDNVSIPEDYQEQYNSLDEQLDNNPSPEVILELDKLHDLIYQK